MKPKLISKHVIVGCLIAVFCLSVGIMGTSCQKRDYPTASQQRKVNKKLPYLEFNTGYTGVGNPSDADKPIIGLVLERVKISKVDGVWQMNIKSSKEANISPEAFRFLEQLIENSNRIDQKLGSGRSSGPIDPSKIIIR